MYDHETEAAVVGKLISEKLWKTLLFGDKRVCAAIVLGHNTLPEIMKFIGITRDTARERLNDMLDDGTVKMNAQKEYSVIDPFLAPKLPKTKSAVYIPKSKLMSGK